MQAESQPASTSSEPGDANVRDRSRDATLRIRRYVADGIASARLQPGDRLPTERDLAQRFRTGRNTVRRTLVALEQEGKIERHVGRGTFVSKRMDGTAPIRPPADPELLLPTIARDASPLDLLEFRQALEPSVAALSAHRASPAEIEQMQAAVDASRIVTTLRGFEDLDDLLHRTIALSTRNPLFRAVADIITVIRNEAEWVTLKEQTLTEDMRRRHEPEHVALVDAIRRRERQAAHDAMAAHLRNVRTMLLKE